MTNRNKQPGKLSETSKATLDAAAKQLDIFQPVAIYEI